MSESSAQNSNLAQNSIWLSFLPQHTATALLAYPDTSPLDFQQRFEAVTLFADFSGFTALSEALTGSGRTSSEELTTILNTYFDQLIQLTTSYGGSVGKFGGDAITVLFPLDPQNPAETSQKAIECAHKMQQHMVKYASIETSVGTFSLAMKIGLARGSIFSTSVGIPPSPDLVGLPRLEYIIAGTVLDHAADAEHRADKGQVVLHSSLEAREDNLTQIAEISLVTETKEIPESLIPILAAYLHPTLTQRISQNQIAYLNEHRRVTILFASFEGFDYDNDPGVVFQLQSYFNEVITIIHKYGGYLNKIDMGDKGSKFIVLFGAPTAYEDNENRALKCALELMSMAYQYVSSFRIGINTGFVYCGLVGSNIRREYTVMGAAVNLAARMMQAAQPGQILVSQFTRSYIRESYLFEELGEITVKGREEPIGVAALLDIDGTRTGSISASLTEGKYNLPMVGRQLELDKINEKMELAHQGKGQVVGISAEAGMGKSRLKAAVIEKVLVTDFQCYGGEAFSYGANLPYHAWHSLVLAFFDLDPNWKLDRQIRQLTTRLLQVSSSLVQRLPLLGPVLNQPIPDNQLTRSMEPKLRKESLEDLLVQCFRVSAQKQPLFLVMEDCHWLDLLSLDLLLALARNSQDLPVFILALYRPADYTRLLILEGVSPDSKAFALEQAGLVNYEEIKLSDFSPTEAQELISNKLNQLWGQTFDTASPALATLRQVVISRALGNPFYIDELINFIKDKKLDPTNSHILENLDLPGTLYNLILSRIDQLEENQKITVKVASIIGRLFAAAWVWGIAPELGAPDQIVNRLNYLSNIELTKLDRPEPELEYFFKHVLTREVAYESLSLAIRITLHEQVGLLLETLYPDQLERYLELLAYHFGQSNNTVKKIHYFSLAAQTAQKAFANRTAIEYYRALLTLLEESEKAPFLLKLGAVLELVSEWLEAENGYKLAHQIATSDTQLRTQIELALGEFYIRQERYGEALPWLEQALNGFGAVGDSPGKSQTLCATGDAYRLQGEYSKAGDYYQRSLELAEAIEERTIRLAIQAKIYKSSGTLFAMQRKLAECEEKLNAGLQLMRELNNKPGMGAIINNLGTLKIISNQPAEAVTLLEEALTIHTELGDLWSSGAALNNLGIAVSMLGDLHTAKLYIEQSIALQRNLGSPSSVANGLSTLADIEIQLGNYTSAESLLLEVFRMQRELNQGRSIAYALEYYAAVCVALNKPAKALKLSGAAAALREALPAPLAPDESATHQKRLQPAKQQLGEELTQSLAQQGHKLDRSAALNLALEKD